MCRVPSECRDVLLPLVTDQLSGQLDDHSTKPDYEACVQLLSTVLDNLDRKDVVRQLLVHVQITVGIISSEMRWSIRAAKIQFIHREHKELRYPWGSQRKTATLYHHKEPVGLN